MTLDPRALEAAARAIYEKRHAGLRDVYDWEDSGLDDEHPGTREFYMRAAEVAVSAYLAATGRWQPIESAPKDGTFFLATNGGHFPFVTAYDDGEDVWFTRNQHWESDERMAAKLRNVPARQWTPTHWMPLPAPPEAP